MNQKDFNEIDSLKQIQEVAVPAFLLTRIHQQIRNRQQEMFIPMSRVWAFAAVFAGIMLLNGWLVYHQTARQQTATDSSALYQVYHNHNFYQ